MGKENVELVPKCTHHWIIGRPINGFSLGCCKNCGEEREFDDSASYPKTKGRKTKNPFLQARRTKPKPKEIINTENSTFTDLQLKIGLAMSKGVVGDKLWKTLGITANRLATERSKISKGMGKSGDKSVKFMVHIVENKLIPIGHLLEEPTESLTTDERNALNLLCRGYKNPEIQSELGIDKPTDVDEHLASAYLKLGTPGRRYQAAARYTALQMEGIIEPINPEVTLRPSEEVIIT